MRSSSPRRASTASTPPTRRPTRLLSGSTRYQEALQRGLKVVDATAFSLCMDNALPMRVFGMQGEHNLRRAIAGEPIGTTVRGA